MNVKHLLCLVPVLLLVGGCSLFRTEPEKPRVPASCDDLIRSHFEQRFREIRTDGELRIAFCPSGPPSAYLIDGRACGMDADAIRLLASVAEWKVSFSVCTRAEAAALVRCGKADAGVGGFTEKDAEETGLSAFTVPNRQGKGGVFLISPHAEDLRKALENASRQ